MRLAAAVHDLALALLVGAVAGVGMAVIALFGHAPSREIAGRIGNVIFARLGPSAVVLAMLMLGTELFLCRARPASVGGAFSISLHVAIFALALIVAFWLTPRMGAIWQAGKHAADGTGLTGHAKDQFLILHIISNLVYLAILIGGMGLVTMRAWLAK